MFTKFQIYKALVENSCSRKIKILHSDNGGDAGNCELKDSSQTSKRGILHTHFKLGFSQLIALKA
jgi:hypothetical protein